MLVSLLSFNFPIKKNIICWSLYFFTPTPIHFLVEEAAFGLKGPESLGNYRPISLCNMVYKIVTKIIVARLRSHLDKLVCPLQSAFVLGRRSVDNAIVVQDLIHTISNKKG